MLGSATHVDWNRICPGPFRWKAFCDRPDYRRILPRPPRSESVDPPSGRAMGPVTDMRFETAMSHLVDDSDGFSLYCNGRSPICLLTSASDWDRKGSGV
jgi:hypothetical protein